MAITQENLSLEGVDKIIRAGREAIDERNSEIDLDKTIQRILELIRVVQNKELALLRSLGFSDYQAFSREVAKIYEEIGLVKFSGQSLKQTFLNNYKLQVYKEKESDQALRAEILLYIQDHLPITNNMTEDDIAKAFHEVIKPAFIEGEISEKGTKISSTRADILEIDNGKIVNVLFDKLTPTINSRLDDIAKNPKWRKKYPGLKDLKFDKRRHLKGKNAQLAVTYRSEWYDAIKDVEKMISNNPNNPKIKKALDAANEKVLQMILSQINSGYRTEAEWRIREMIGADPKLFLAGGNEKKITGILGEISAYIALKRIFPAASLSWVATKTQEGKQLSADMILRIGAEKYGIQIKNTSQSDFDLLKINFLDLNIETVFKRLFSDESEMVKMQPIQTALETSRFNFSYNLVEGTKGTVAEKGSNDVFDEKESELLKLQQDIHTYLMYYAPEMIFADTLSQKSMLGNFEKDLEEKAISGNTLYMIAGVPHFASEELEKIGIQLTMLEQSLQNSNIKILEYFKIAETGPTIVDYINNQKKDRKSMALKDISIKMTSSMSF